MFTGIVEELGTVESVERQSDAVRLTVHASTVLEDAGALEEGDAAARRRYRAADLHGIEAGARRDPLVGGTVVPRDDVGHVRPVAAGAADRAVQL